MSSTNKDYRATFTAEANLSVDKAIGSLKKLNNEIKKMGIGKDFTDDIQKDLEAATKASKKFVKEAVAGFKNPKEFDAYNKNFRNIEKIIEGINNSFSKMDLSDEMNARIDSVMKEVSKEVKILQKNGKDLQATRKNELTLLLEKEKMDKKVVQGFVKQAKSAGDYKKAIQSANEELDKLIANEKAKTKETAQPNFSRMLIKSNSPKDAYSYNSSLVTNNALRARGLNGKLFRKGTEADVLDRTAVQGLVNEKYVKILKETVLTGGSAIDIFSRLSEEVQKYGVVLNQEIVGKNIVSDLNATNKAFSEEQKNVKTRIKAAEKELATLQKQKALLQETGKGGGLNDKLEKIDASSIQRQEQINQLKERESVLVAEIIQQYSQYKQMIDVGLKETAVHQKNMVEQQEESTEENQKAIDAQVALNNTLDNLKNRALQIFSITQAYRLLHRVVMDTFNTVKDLDAELAQIAMVSDYSLPDMWTYYDNYSKIAVKYGQATKDVVAASGLYIQQGLSMAESMELTEHTMKLATLAGIDFKQATSEMTSALRGFKMDMDEGQRVLDVYSELAAKTASDVEGIAYAISKSASIAESAGMSFESTSAFLAQMIETTQEAPENIGTAMKTIIARFTELKENVSGTMDSEFDDLDYNKVDKALKSVNVNLKDTTGQFRDLDEVFLELSGKWNTLDRNTQRYIATIAAGSRQQSRFLAMMSNYERTTELMELANNSMGKADQQIGKYVDAVQYKLNQLSAKFEKFRLQFLNADNYKGVIDAVSKLVDVMNNMDTKDAITFGAFGLIAGRLFIKSFSKEILKETSKTFTTIRTNITDSIHRGITDGFDKVNGSIGKTSGNLLSSPFVKSMDKKVVGTGFGFGEITKAQFESANRLSQGNDHVLMRILKIDQKNLEKIRTQYNELQTIQAENLRDIEERQEQAISTATSAATSATTMAIGIYSATKDLDAALNASLVTLGGFTLNLVAQFANAAAASYAGAKSVGTAISAGFASTGVGAIIIASIAAITGIAKGLYAIHKNYEAKNKSLTQKLEETKAAIEEMEGRLSNSKALTKENKETLKSTEELKEKFEELNVVQYKSVEQQEEYEGLVEQVKDNFPEIITYYDEVTGKLEIQNKLWDDIISKQKQTYQKAAISEYSQELILNNEERYKAELEQEQKIYKYKKENAYFTEKAAKIQEKSIGKSTLTNQEMAINEAFAYYSRTDKTDQDAANLEDLFRTLLYEESSTREQIIIAELEAYEKVLEEEQEALDKLFEENQKLSEQRLIMGVTGNSQGVAKVIQGQLNTVEKTIEKGYESIIKVNENGDYELIKGGSSGFFNLAGGSIGNRDTNNALDKWEKLDSRIKKMVEGSFATSEEAQAFWDSNIKDQEVLANLALSGYIAQFRAKQAELIAKGFSDTQIDLIEQFVKNAESGLSLTELSNQAALVTPYLSGAQAESFIQMLDEYEADIEEQRSKLATFIGATYTDNLYEELTAANLEAINRAIENISEDEATRQAYGEFLQKFFATNGLNRDQMVALVNTSLGELDFSSILKDRQAFQDLLPEFQKENAEELFSNYITEIERITGKKYGIQNAGSVSILVGNMSAEYGAIRERNSLLLKAQEEFTKEGQLSDEIYFEMRANNLDEFLDYNAQGYGLLADKINGYLVESVSNVLATYNEAISRNKMYIKELEDQVGDFEMTSDIRLAYDNDNEKRLQELGVTKEQVEAYLQLLEQYQIKSELIANEERVQIENLKELSRTYTLAENALSDLKDELEQLEEEEKKAVKSLKELNKEIKDAEIALQEAYHGTKNYKSGLDSLVNYDKKLQKVTRSLQDAKDALLGSENLGDSVSSLSIVRSLEREAALLSAAKDRLATQEKANIEAIIQREYGQDFSKNSSFNFDIERLDANDEIRKAYDDLFNKWWELDAIQEEIADKEKERLEEEKERQKSSLQNMVSIQEKIVEVLKAAAEEEIDISKDKYEALENADNEYLDALEEAIEKQRALREKENMYEELAQKEKRLSLMRRDTSGSNQKEIQSLEQEIEKSRTDILDKEVDDFLSSMRELYETQKEARDAELEYLDALMETTDWFIQANKIMENWTSSDAMKNWFMNNDPTFGTNSAEQNELYLMELDEDFAKFAEHRALMLEDTQAKVTFTEQEVQKLMDSISSNLIGSSEQTVQLAKDSAAEIQEAAEKTLNDLKEKRIEEQEGLVELRKDIKETENDVLLATNNVKNAYKSSLDGMLKATEFNNTMVQAIALNTIGQFLGADIKTEEGRKLIEENANYKIDTNSDAYKVAIGELTLTDDGNDDGKTKNYYLTLADGKTKNYYLTLADGTVEYFETYDEALKKKQSMIARKPNSQYDVANYMNYLNATGPTKAFKEGGLVDFTGPAWVDGTKSSPEAFLNPKQTSMFSNFIANLESLVKQKPLKNEINNFDKNAVSSPTVNITLNVDNIDGDYSVDQMLERVQQKIYDITKPIGSPVILVK